VVCWFGINGNVSCRSAQAARDQQLLNRAVRFVDRLIGDAAARQIGVSSIKDM
jgi:hypothetical protein